MRTFPLLLAAAGLLSAQTAVYPGGVVTDNQLRVAANQFSVPTLVNSITASDTTALITNASGIPINSIVTMDNEHMAVCNVSGNTLTFGKSSCPNTDGRAFDGTAAASHTHDATVNLNIDAWHQKAAAAELKAIETALGSNLGNITKTTVGLGNVTNDLQLKAALNLSDVPDPAAARTNLGVSQNTAEASLYNWAPITPTGSPSISIGSNTLTIAVAPLAMSHLNSHYYVYISGGTGTAEAALVTGGTCTSGATVCSLIITAIHTHSGGYTLSPANAGIQECAIANAGHACHITAGTYLIYKPVYLASKIKLTGDGMFSTLLQAQSANGGVIDEDAGGRCVFEDLGLTAVSQQTSGGYGIRIGNSAESFFDAISRIYCEPLYDCVLGVNANQPFITDSVFYNFSHTAVTAGDAACPDCDGPWIKHNVMFNYLLATPAEACLYFATSGVVSFIDNKCVGSDVNQLNYGIHLSNNPSTGLLVTGNEFETVMIAGIQLEGAYNLINITGNFFAQPGGLPAYGIRTGDVAGAGPWQGSITGNVFQGPGKTYSSYGVVIQGHAYNWIIDSNSFNLLQYGIYTDGSGTVTIGVQDMNVSTIETPVFASSGQTTMNFPAPLPFAKLPNAANGSSIYCTDCNSTGTAAGGTGKTLFRENGIWTPSGGGGGSTSSTGEVSYYNFAPITPAGPPTTITAGSRTLTVPIAPPGMSAATPRYYVYISGGTGTPEAALVTGGTCAPAATNCTLTMTVANTHSGAYVLTSASSGLAECVAASPLKTCHMAGGTYTMNATVYVQSGGAFNAMKILGDGSENTQLTPATASMGVIDSDAGAGLVIEDMGFQTLTQGTAGGYAVRVGTVTVGYYHKLVRIRCQGFYDCVKASTAGQGMIRDSIFYNFTHDAIVANDTIGSGDGVGWSVIGNIFYNFALVSPANAALDIIATGQEIFTGNFCAGNDVNQLNNGILLHSNLSTGLTVTGNNFQTMMNAHVSLSGTWNSVNISGNTFLQPGSISAGYGVLIQDGGGTGVTQGTIVGNVFQGPGGSNTHHGVNLEGATGNWSMGLNSFTKMDTAYWLNSSGTITVGPSDMSSSVTKPMDGGASLPNTRLNMVAPVTFSQLLNAGNGSALYCTNCNSTCSAGASSGRTCFRENGAWVH